MIEDVMSFLGLCLETEMAFGAVPASVGQVHAVSMKVDDGVKMLIADLARVS